MIYIKKYYLAYGSNLNLDHMKYRCPSAKPIGTMELKGYRLIFKGSCKDYSYLTIEPDENSTVPLGIFELSFLDIFSLDKYEGYPSLYHKINIPIKVRGQDKKALIYVMNDMFDYNLPSSSYVDVCMDGYNDFGFDPEILKKALIDTSDIINKKGKTKIK